MAGPDGGGVGLRLAGWGRLEIAPGETRSVEVAVDPRLLSTFDEAARRWRIAPGAYRISAGFDAARRDLSADVTIRPPTCRREAHQAENARSTRLRKAVRRGALEKFMS